MKSEKECVSCSVLSIFLGPMDCSSPGSSVHEFSRQQYWSGQPFPSPGDLLRFQTGSPAFRSDSLLSETPGIYGYKSLCVCVCVSLCVYFRAYKNQENIKLQRARDRVLLRLIDSDFKDITDDLVFFSILNLVSFSDGYQFKCIGRCCINSIH